MKEHDADLMLLLHDVARLVRVEADRRARMHDMTRAQWVILMRLERRPGMSQKELAEILEVEPMTVARLVDRLEARGMLERRADPSDRRVWRLHLLAPSAPVLADIAVARAELAHAATAGLDGDMQRAMAAALRRMKGNLTGARAEPAELETA